MTAVKSAISLLVVTFFINLNIEIPDIITANIIVNFIASIAETKIENSPLIYVSSGG